ncbi:putative WD repeat-containing protein [Drosera capensis]
MVHLFHHFGPKIIKQTAKETQRGREPFHSIHVISISPQAPHPSPPPPPPPIPSIPSNDVVSPCSCSRYDYDDDDDDEDGDILIRDPIGGLGLRMSEQHGDDTDFIDEYEMDVDDDMEEDFRERELVGSDSDADEYGYLDKKADTSAAEARRGRDIQGIPWERLSVTREKYRQTRLEQYTNYENIAHSGEGSQKDCNITKKGGKYYDFRHNSRSVKSTILHFQLRNLVWATTKHDVYLMSHFSVIHWSSLTRNKTEVLNVSGHVAPTEKHPGSLLEGFTQTQVSTLAVKDNLLVAGGFQGELICKNLRRPGVSFCTRTTYDDNAITNALEIYAAPSGAIRFTASNNDCGVRDFDMETFQLTKHFQYPWPVNHTSLSPGGNLLVIVGDDPDGLVVDPRDGKTVATLHGHLDFSFASAWNPDGMTFATGNQDKTCRVWDVRNLSKSVVVLKGNLGAIRSIRYTSDGRYMATAEPADFVHVYDAKKGYEEEQEIDFFGEISGISFSPDTESFFVGIWDRTYGSLLEYGRRRNYSYLDSVYNHISRV